METTKRKRLHPVLIAFFILVGITILLCGTVAALWLHGRYELSKPVDVPLIPELTSPAEEQESAEAHIIEYNGKRYQYNSAMRNILLLGIDADGTAAEGAGNHNQSDVLVIAALNLESNRMTLINVSRDTMCDMEVKDQSGEFNGLLHTQLALSYAYGDGQHKSCELTSNAVSSVFYGLPFHGYAAFYMDGMATLNDAVGGVTVNILEDYPFVNIPGCDNMVAGRNVTLTGRQARLYVQARLEDRLSSNDLRIQRQKQYLLALVSKAKQSVLENPASILNLYSAVDDYILTDLSLSQISYLATLAAGIDFSGDIRSVTGNTVLGEDNLAELQVDQTALYELMLDVFYNELPSE